MEPNRVVVTNYNDCLCSVTSFHFHQVCIRCLHELISAHTFLVLQHHLQHIQCRLDLHMHVSGTTQCLLCCPRSTYRKIVQLHGIQVSCNSHQKLGIIIFNSCCVSFNSLDQQPEILDFNFAIQCTGAAVKMLVETVFFE